MSWEHRSIKVPEIATKQLVPTRTHPVLTGPSAGDPIVSCTFFVEKERHRWVQGYDTIHTVLKAEALCRN